MKYFAKKELLLPLIEEYFNITLDNPNAKTAGHPTLTGLATHLGFKSKDEFELYESKGLLKNYVKAARLKIMAYYESRLLLPSPTGAMFALKGMGWDDKLLATEHATSIKIKLIETGPKPASSEKELLRINHNLKANE